MNITLIYGGRSGEHEISLISASAILSGIDNAVQVSAKWYDLKL